MQPLVRIVKDLYLTEKKRGRIFNEVEADIWFFEEELHQDTNGSVTLDVLVAFDITDHSKGLGEESMIL